MNRRTSPSREQGRFRVSLILAIGIFVITGAALYVMSRYAGQLQPIVASLEKKDPAASEHKYLVGEAGPFAIVQIYGDGFEKLTPKQRLVAYHLAEAGIAGDPIFYDQIADYGLALKQLLEGIWTHSDGIDPAALEKIRNFTQLVWIQH